MPMLKITIDDWSDKALYYATTAISSKNFLVFPSF